MHPHIGKTFLWHPHASTHGAIPNPISSGPNLCQSPPFAGACGGILQGGCEPPGFEAKLRDQLIKELEHLEHSFRDDTTSFFVWSQFIDPCLQSRASFGPLYRDH